MTRIQIIKIHLRSLRFTIRETIIDLVGIVWPTFFLTGLIAACAKFWMWVFFA